MNVFYAIDKVFGAMLIGQYCWIFFDKKIRIEMFLFFMWQVKNKNQGRAYGA